MPPIDESFIHYDDCSLLMKVKPPSNTSSKTRHLFELERLNVPRISREPFWTGSGTSRVRRNFFQKPIAFSSPIFATGNKINETKVRKDVQE